MAPNVYAKDLPPRILANIERTGLGYAPWAATHLERIEGDLFGEAPVRGLLFHGPTGVGKSHAVATFTLRVRERSEGLQGRARRFVRYVSDRGLLRAARDAMSAGNLGTYIDCLADGKGLVLDDLGSGIGGYTAWEQGILNDLVGAAYDAGAALVVTSNHDLAGLAAALGARVPSRIAEVCEVVGVAGADRRLLAAGSAS